MYVLPVVAARRWPRAGFEFAMKFRVVCLGSVLVAAVAVTVRITASRRTEPLDPLAVIVGDVSPTRANSDSLAVPPRRRVPIARFPRRTVADLVDAKGWTSFLRTWHGLPLASTRAELTARLDAATGSWLADAGPVVRQNLIFGVALMAPWEAAAERLRALWKTATDPADAEDALCALAFSGDPEAREAFLALARSPSGAVVHRLVDTWQDLDAIAAPGDAAARETLRAWRSIEALDREPYFKLVAFEVTYDWSGEGSRELLGFRPARPQTPVERQSLLEAWLARWPGHPGSDGMALRVARLRLDAGDLAGAATWFARALTGMDQDRASRAEGPIVALAECVLPLDTVEAFARTGLGDVPARTLFQYAWLRRTAAEVGFERACDAVSGVASREPDGAIAAAWRGRHEARPPTGLSSGVLVLAADDRLLAEEDCDDVEGVLSASSSLLASELAEARDRCVRPYAYKPEDRLNPDRDPARLDPNQLRAQFRAWETLAELERRASRAGGLLHGDLLYKQAAVFYHDRAVLHPCYAWQTFDFGARISSLDADPESAISRPSASAAFARTSFAWVRAAELFERIEREHPDYPEMDKVVFSGAMCWKRLADYRPSRATDWLAGTKPSHSYSSNRTTMHCARRAVARFDRVAREFPSSPLADDSERAAAWWRRLRGDWLDESETAGR